MGWIISLVLLVFALVSGDSAAFVASSIFAVAGSICFASNKKKGE